MHCFSPALAAAGNHSDVWKCATALEAQRAEIESWDLGAGIFLEYYSLKNHLEHVLDPLGSKVCMHLCH